MQRMISHPPLMTTTPNLLPFFVLRHRETFGGHSMT
jgi:hypothetical protein